MTTVTTPEGDTPTGEAVVDVLDETSDVEETTPEFEAAPDAEAEVEAPAAEPEEELDPATALKAELRSKPGDWFVIHSYAGYENKVKANLETRVQNLDVGDYIFQVEVPTEEVTEIKNGQRKQVNRKVLPGYILVRMELNDESWGAVRNTPGVTGFVGMGNDPTPLRPEEVAQIVKRMEAEAPTVKVTFKVGERVRIVDGPFNDFRGVVSEIDMERTKVRVMVSFFGRETPVELDFLQVEKA